MLQINFPQLLDLNLQIAKLMYADSTLESTSAELLEPTQNIIIDYIYKHPSLSIHEFNKLTTILTITVK